MTLIIIDIIKQLLAVALIVYVFLTHYRLSISEKNVIEILRKRRKDISFVCLLFLWLMVFCSIVYGKVHALRLLQDFPLVPGAAVFDGEWQLLHFGLLLVGFVGVRIVNMVIEYQQELRQNKT